MKRNRIFDLLHSNRIVGKVGNVLTVFDATLLDAIDGVDLFENLGRYPSGVPDDGC